MASGQRHPAVRAANPLASSLEVSGIRRVVLRCIVLLGCLIHAQAPAAYDPHLVAYWKLNGDGTDAVAGNTLSPIGTVSYSPGRLGSAADFSGVEPTRLLASAPHSYDLTPAGFTVEFWARYRTATDFRFIRADSAGDAQAWEVYRSGATGGRFGISIHHSGGLVEFASQTIIPDQLFHHYAMTYDGNAVRLYFDGVLDTTVAVGSIQALVGGGGIALGNSVQSGSAMDGLVDEVRIWNVARTATQIQSSKDSELSQIQPFSCSASDNDPSLITITWTNVLGVDGYHVYRDNVLIATQPPGSLSLADSVAPGSYTYCVEPFVGSSCTAQACDIGTRTGTQGLVAYWKLNGDGTDAVAGNTLIPAGTVSFSSGQLGLAADFPGVDPTRLHAPAPHSYDLTPAGFTVEFWARYRTSSTFRFIRADSAGDAQAWEVYRWSPTGQFGISIHNSGALVEFFSQTVIPDQLFHHYAMTYDGSDVRLYFDGVHDTTVTVGSIQALVGGGDIALGNSARTGSPMDGLVDDVRVWNVARTATQIQNSKDAELTLTIPGPPAALPPLTPCAFTASDNDSTQILLTWSDVGNETGYRLYRDGAQFAMPAASQTTYSDQIAVGVHTYCIEAFNANGTSGQICDIGTRPTPRTRWIANGLPICTATSAQQQPYACTDGAGGAIIAWVDARTSASTSNDIYAQRADATGNVLWATNGTPLCTATGSQDSPRTVPDGTGGAIVFWRDGRATSAVYAQHVSASGLPSWASNGVPVAPFSGTQSLPRAIPDGAGGGIVTWQDTRASDDIYCQRIGPNGATSWTSDGVPVCADPGSQSVPVIARSGDGAIIAWVDSRKVTETDIYAQRIDSSGSPRWAADGIPICAAVGNQAQLRIVGDGTGGAILVWQDLRIGPTGDLYAQRVDSLGVVRWATDGVSICSAPDDQANPALAASGPGSATIAWEDRRNGTDKDIYAQRVNSGGTVSWATDGIAVCIATGNQTLSFSTVPILQLEPIVEDGSGGVVLAWTDPRVSPPSIYAQRLDASGNALWTSNGTKATTPGGNESMPTIVADGVGGAILAFRRTGNITDIYGTRIAPQGGLYLSGVDAPKIDRPNVSLELNRPNPFNPRTSIRFSLSAPQVARVTVYDVQGRQVARLWDRPTGAGPHEVFWDGRESSGNEVGSGVYFYEVHTASCRIARKMVLAR